MCVYVCMCKSIILLLMELLLPDDNVNYSAQWPEEWGGCHPTTGN